MFFIALFVEDVSMFLSSRRIAYALNSSKLSFVWSFGWTDRNVSQYL